MILYDALKGRVYHDDNRKGPLFSLETTKLIYMILPWAKFELFSQTSSSEGSNERKRQSTTPNSRSESPKISDCGAINLVVHKRRPPPILEESDQTVPSCPNTNASSSSKSDSTKTSPDPSKSGLKSEVKIYLQVPSNNNVTWWCYRKW